MSVLFGRIEAGVTTLSRTIANVGVVGVVLIALVLIADIILRGVFNVTVPSAVELVQLLMVLVVSLGMAYCTLQRRQIEVDVLVSRLSARTQAAIGTATSLAALVLAGLMCWRTFSQAHVTAARDLSIGTLGIPMAPFMYIMAAGLALLTVAVLVLIVKTLPAALRGGKRTIARLTAGVIVVVAAFTAPYWIEWLPWEASRLQIGIIGMVFLFLLMFARMPIGFAMAVAGIIGMACIVGYGGAIPVLGLVPFLKSMDYTLSTLPLFILMGMIAFHSDLIGPFFSTVNKWIGHIPGGLAIATIFGCTGFAAVSASSTVTAVVMGQTAYPEMKRYGYADRLSTGVLAVGGTLGILIPPSAGFIIYALFTEQSIGKLFMAGIIPGLILCLLLTGFVYGMVKVRPELGPRGQKFSFAEKRKAIWGVLPVLVLFLIVMVGIYTGLFTPTESAAVGVAAALIIGVARRKLSWKGFIASIVEAGHITAMIFLVLIGAQILTEFMTITTMNTAILGFVEGLAAPRIVILILVMVMYLILGCLMDFYAMTALTLPVVFPMMVNLGYDPIWFGVIMVIMMEAAMITPPMGINVFALTTIIKDVPMYTMFKGVLPFVFALFVLIAILIAFPQIVLLLPNM